MLVGRAALASCRGPGRKLPQPRACSRPVAGVAGAAFEGLPKDKGVALGLKLV